MSRHFKGFGLRSHSSHQSSQQQQQQQQHQQENDNSKTTNVAAGPSSQPLIPNRSNQSGSGINNANISPRKSPLPPSPTQSTHSAISGLSIGQAQSSQYQQQQQQKSGTPSPYLNDRPRAQSFDIPRGATAHQPAPVRNDSQWSQYSNYRDDQGRLGVPGSPRKGGAGVASGAGLYDTKLVASTLSQIPNPAPLSPNPTGGSAITHQASSSHLASFSALSARPSGLNSRAGSSFASGPGSSVGSGGASTSNSVGANGGSTSTSVPAGGSTHNPVTSAGMSMAVTPSSFTLATSHAHPPGSAPMSASGTSLGVGLGLGHGHGAAPPAASSSFTAQGEFHVHRSDARTVKETLAHSSPSSPWSQLTINALPVFAGSTVKSSMETLNQLCSNHILASAQRTSAARLTAVLSSDVRDFIASGMLTLKSRLEGGDEDLVQRMADIWWFFWTRVLSYLEGVFLPFAQLRDSTRASDNTTTYQSSSSTMLDSASASTSISAHLASQPIPIRHLLLSGFLTHILLPSISHLVSSINSPTYPSTGSGSDTRLQRIQHMSLILGTQALYSSFRSQSPAQVPSQQDANPEVGVAAEQDKEVKEHVEQLGKAVRRKWDVVEGLIDEQSDNGGDATGNGAAYSGGRGQGHGQGSDDVAQKRRSAAGVQRKASMMGRKRRGWRASAAPELGIGLGGSASAGFERLGVGQGIMSAQAQGSAYMQQQINSTQSHAQQAQGRMSRQHSDVAYQGGGGASTRWGPVHIDEEDDDDGDHDGMSTIPAQSRGEAGTGVGGGTSYGYSVGTGSDATATAPSTVTARGAWREGIDGAGREEGTGGGEDESTPVGDQLGRMVGSSGIPSGLNDGRRAQRV